MLVLWLVISLLAPAPVTGSCAGLVRPMPGDVVRPFAPDGRYAGHWGIDISADVGTPVRAAAPGKVTFAGVVVGVRSVTVGHGGGLRTSYSYLDDIAVVSGQWVSVGDTLGYSGLDHDLAALHFSVRIGDVYHDPERWLVCLTETQPALHLVAVESF